MADEDGVEVLSSDISSDEDSHYSFDWSEGSDFEFAEAKSARFNYCSYWRGLRKWPPCDELLRYHMFILRDPNPSEWTRLHAAVWNDDLKNVMSYVKYHEYKDTEVLLEVGKFGETALQLALRLERSVQMIRLLLRGEGSEAVNMGLKDYSHLKLNQNAILYGNEYFPIHEAINYYDDEEAFAVTTLLLNNGADVNKRNGNGFMPIEQAGIFKGRVRLMRLLLQHGATLREDALFSAAVVRSAQVLEFLFEKFPDSAERHQQALLLVVRRGDLEAIKICFGAGVRLSAQEARKAVASVGKEPGDFPFVKAPDWPQKMKSIKKLINDNKKKK